jgi:4-amino-4-deoxy-L-arabinose transferase-like glycosyltransferase
LAGTAWRWRLIFVLPLLSYLVPLFLIPFERDEATYAAMAQAIMDGRIPYRDMFDHKPPPIYAWYVLSFLLFGEHQHAPRIMAAILLCATAPCVFVVARALFEPRRAYAVTAVFGISTGAVLAKFNANSELFALLPATAALALLMQPQRRANPHVAFASGLLIAIAIWTRPLFLPAGAALGAWLLVEQRRHPRVPAAFLVGGIVTIPLLCAPFALTGTLGDFKYAVLDYQRLYFNEYEGFRWVFLITAVPRTGIALAGLAVAAFFGLSTTLRQHVWTRSHALFFVWSIGTLAGQFIAGRYAGHYAALMLPVLAIFAGFLPDSPRWSRRSPAMWVLASAVAVSVAGNAIGFLEVTDDSHGEHQASLLAQEIKATTAPDDLIWEFGRLAAPYFEAQRRSPTRFIYDRPFWLDPSTLNEAITDVRANPPVLIVDSFQAEAPYPSAGIDTPLNGYFYPGPVALLLAERYELDRRAYGVTLYRLKQG